MPKITVLAHPQICPNGAEINANKGDNLCELLLENDIEIEHACELSCACTTCHVIIKNQDGFNSLNESDELEDDQLDKAWGLQPNSRLACQVEISDTDLVVEIPKYTINHAKENH